MIHDCEATQERLVELLFGEVEEGRRAPAREELEDCAACRAQYNSLAETLRAFDRAAEASLPAEDFWPGYEERLKKRMSQEIQPNIWQAAGFSPLARGEYQLTFLEDDGLTRRLTRELKSVAHDAELTWPEFKRDPVGFTSRSVTAYSSAGWKFFSQRNVALAVLASFVILFSAVGLVTGLERLRMSRAVASNPNADLELLGMVPDTEIPREQERPEKGHAGTAKGKGGGMKAKQEKPGGGGGGGRQEQTPPSAGKLPQASLLPQIMPPSPHPPKVPNPHLAVPQTVRADPTLFPPDSRPIPIGDPNSKSTVPSSGPGTGDGIGTGTGSGVGSGDGQGVGPGRDFNAGGGDGKVGGGGPGGGGGGGGIDYTKTFRQNEVTRKAVITFKPEPGFTEEARKNNVTGVVRLRAVLSSSGSITSISVIKPLPDGLTEKAISAARQIRFQPAQKDGRTVSQYIVLEYNFNIY